MLKDYVFSTFPKICGHLSKYLFILVLSSVKCAYSSSLNASTYTT